MARRYALYHTATLDDEVRPYDATVWAENIGYARTLRRVVNMWMHSLPHRQNLLNRRLRFAAIGVAHAHGWFWVTTPMYG